MNEESESILAQVRALAIDMLMAVDSKDAMRVLDIADEQDFLLASIRMDWRADKDLLPPGQNSATREQTL